MMVKRRGRVQRVLIVVAIMSVIILSAVFFDEKQIGELHLNTIATNSAMSNKFKETINRYTLNGIILIASFDVTYAGMALNLYLTSFKRFGITNHLFVSLDSEGCEKLLPFGAHCMQYTNMSKIDDPSLYDSPDYNMKACAKPWIVLDLLKVGVSVVLVDLDIVFLNNPLPYITECVECDFVSQVHPGVGEVNSGFFLVRNTSGGLLLFEETVRLIPEKPTGDQVYLNRALKKLGDAVKARCLPPDLFPLGDRFFMKGHRMFVGDHPCTDCVIVHNNYIVSVEAKSYRFKEYGMWMVDTDGYYSDPNRKYLTYENPIDFSEHKEYGVQDTIDMELKSLKVALVIGRILNRAVILPKFHCRGARGYQSLPGEKCHFGMHFAVRSLDAYLPALERYRENSFLVHPLVPASTRTSVSRSFVIDGPVWQKEVRLNPSMSEHVVIRKPQRCRLTSGQILEWFSNETAHVLTFHSLYNDLDENDGEIENMLTILSRAIKRSDYIQFDA